MDISTETFNKDIAIISVAGRVDSSNANELEDAIKGITDGGVHKLVFDLAGISYISSMGIRALISAKKSCKKRFGDAVLSQPSEAAAEVINIAGLSHVFTIFDDNLKASHGF